MSVQEKDIKNKIALFENKEVRRTWHNEQWYFSILDVVSVLTDSVQPDGYIKDMRRRDPELLKGWGQIATPLPIKTKGGIQNMNCSNLQGIFRIIQSIPSSKAEPFKIWLAKDGGMIAGNTRKEIELKSGKKVMSKGNYLKKQNKKLP